MLLQHGSWHNVVGLATRLWAGQAGVRIPVGGGDFSLLRNIQTGCVGHQASCLMGTGILSPR
jgi:hypothetical protein